MFKEALKSDDFVAILRNYMKSLEDKMKELFEITSSAKNSQIKGELQLKDETVNFICTKFEEYGKERKEREQIIKNVEGNISVINEQVENLGKEMSKYEQYSRQNCLLGHGIVIETISMKMNIRISLAVLDETRRIGKKKAGQNEPRRIIVKLSWHNVRKKIFSKKPPERIHCKYNGKRNTKTHRSSKERKVRTWVHKLVDI